MLNLNRYCALLALALEYHNKEVYRARLSISFKSFYTSRNFQSRPIAKIYIRITRSFGSPYLLESLANSLPPTLYQLLPLPIRKKAKISDAFLPGAKSTW